MSFFADDSVHNYQWLFLDLNSYFASIEQQLCPDLRGKPIAVIPLESEATSAIAASYEAKAYGVKTGTKVYDAKRMCPGIIFVLARHEVYVEYHHRILEELDRHLPIESVESIDEAACRLMGPQCNEDTSMEIARAIKAGIHAHIGNAIHCSIGIAPNKYLAKIGTELQKPNGLVVIKKETILEQLRVLKLNDLTGIGRGMSARLERANIHTIEQLWQCSPKELRRIWGGVGGERFWYQLRGHELPDIATQRRTVGHSHVLSPEWRPPEQAYIVAQRLTLKAAARLRRLGYYAQGLHLSIRPEYGERLHCDTAFHRANDSVTLKAMLTKNWNQLMSHNQGRPIKKISVTLHELTPNHQIQHSLFDEPNQHTERYEKLSQAMDQLNAKFGRDTIVTGFLPKRSHNFSGTKIAFTRIPHIQEFHE